MADCETQLWELVRDIEPTPSQKKKAQKSHDYLRNILGTGKMAYRIQRSFLSGSYSRNTAIKPLDDVDIVFLIDPSYWPSSFLSPLPSPDSVLKTFANAIRYRYRFSSVFRQRRSVSLRLHHLAIDVVPAIESDEDELLIRIPDTESNDWILTSPQRHAEKAASVNRWQNRKFKPLVKLLKLWNGNLPSTACFKSFAIETMAVRVFQTIKFDSLQDGLLKFFDFVAFISGNNSALSWKDSCGISFGWLGCKVPDIARTGGNVTAGVDGERKKRFIENAIRSRNKMVDADNSLSVETAYRKIAEALKIRSV